MYVYKAHAGVVPSARGHGSSRTDFRNMYKLPHRCNELNRGHWEELLVLYHLVTSPAPVFEF